MKINSRILCIPPYVSTLWINVASLHMTGHNLVVSLCDGKTIEIPDLDPMHVESIFHAHATALAEKTSPFRIGFGTIDGMGMPVQHDPEQANAPDLPPEVLERISAISKIIKPDDTFIAQLADPSCNCMFCQISRAMSGVEKPQIEEEVPIEELAFQQWEIVQNNDKMYTVIDKINKQQQFTVFLGQPVGCTCGQNGCEHVVAVLKS